ncbi:MAG: hypothetical protein AABZ64_02750 [Nitrospinota bacterium]
MSPDPIHLVHEDSRGRVFTADSMTYFDGRVGAKDVVISGSYAARATIGWALGLGVRGVISHAAGVGKDDAGISGLPLAESFGVPAAACETMSARLADGASVHGGRVGHANPTALRHGVRVGQPVTEAARLMLDAPPGEKRSVQEAADNRIHTFEETPRGNICGSWGIPVLRSIKEPRPRDVFVQASHCGLTLSTYVIPLRLKGVIATDAGRGMDDSGLAAFPVFDEAGVPAAAVGAMTARIGDVLSVWNEGVISAVNRVAEGKGVRPGMTAKEAARKMLG